MNKEDKKYFLLGLLILLFGLLVMQTAHAAPYIVCDPSTGITSYNVTGGSWFATNTVVAQSDGSLKMDAASAPVGTTNMTVQACMTDPIWGSLCNVTPAPFVLTRPSVPTIPKNIKLIP